MSISIGNSRNKQVHLRFIDSLQFMSDSLESLVENINNFYHLESAIRNENINLLKKKGIYPYDYMNSWDKFNETKLPSESLFFSKLNNEHISDKDYEHAINILNRFKINNLGDYHDLYLKTDVLLADVFENFRKMCLNYYKLYAAHYFSAPGLAWDAALKKSGITLELFTDPDMYLFAEKGIRGGISVLSNIYSKANNKYMGQKYNKNKKSKYIMYLDANNLYGYAMSQSLPTGNFKFIDPTNFDTNKINENKKYGYMFEVDLEYPHELHDSHSDYPLAPERLLVDNNMLSEYSKILKIN